MVRYLLGVSVFVTMLILVAFAVLGGCFTLGALAYGWQAGFFLFGALLWLIIYGLIVGAIFKFSYFLYESWKDYE